MSLQSIKVNKNTMTIPPFSKLTIRDDDWVKYNDSWPDELGVQGHKVQKNGDQEVSSRKSEPMLGLA